MIVAVKQEHDIVEIKTEEPEVEVVKKRKSDGQHSL